MVHVYFITDIAASLIICNIWAQPIINYSVFCIITARLILWFDHFIWAIVLIFITSWSIFLKSVLWVWQFNVNNINAIALFFYEDEVTFWEVNNSTLYIDQIKQSNSTSAVEDAYKINMLLKQYCQSETSWKYLC